jgi:5-deoxy-glucuronate isomerase
MKRPTHLRSRSPRGPSGTVVSITPRQAGWQFVQFSVRTLAPGATWRDATRDREACLVLLGGCVEVSWGEARHVVGPRRDVFSSYPHAVYLPPGVRFEVRALEPSQLADGRAPARVRHDARVIRPEDCGFEIRGGGNATRQIVDILPPAFPADRLLICEVFTPGGNWSSYPPHKHDADDPPREVALEEVYYYRFREPDAYGIQRLYAPGDRGDRALTVHDGDLVLVHNGYHPFVSAHGYDAYYLNVLAGNRRSMAASDDPRYARFRERWPEPDPRVPTIEPPYSRTRVPKPTWASGPG